jgi:hypothetical protein
MEFGERSKKFTVVSRFYGNSGDTETTPGLVGAEGGREGRAMAGGVALRLATAGPCIFFHKNLRGVRRAVALANGYAAIISSAGPVPKRSPAVRYFWE